MGSYAGLFVIALITSRARLLLAAAALIQCLAASYVALFPGFTALLKASFFLFGAAGNIVVPLTGMIITRAGEGQAARDLNIHYGFFSAGVMAAPLYAGLLFNVGYHYGLSYSVLSVLACIGLIVVIFSYVPAVKTGERLNREDFREVFTNRGRFLAVVLIVNFLYVSAESIPNTWIPQYFTGLFPGYSAFGTRLILTLFWGTITIGRYFCAALLHRGLRPVTLMLALSGLAAVWLFLASSTGNGTVAGVLFSTSGFFFSGMFPIIASSLEALPGRFTNMGYIFLISTGMIGATSISKLAGFIADRAGFPISMKMGTLFLLLAVVVLALKGREIQNAQSDVRSASPSRS
jgi:FHS family glucose/mannose:H+ symporter-like MFS transporter